MKEILEEILRSNGIEYYFYTFKEDIDSDYLDGNTIYIKGSESYIPGILEKTLKAFDFVKDYSYDYIVRSNISTIVNFNLLDSFLQNNDFDYSGPIGYTGFHECSYSGLTKEKQLKYSNVQWCAGICLIFSRKAIHELVNHYEEIISLEIVDDVAIGIYLWEQKNVKIKKHLMDQSCVCHSGDTPTANYLFFRNKCLSRKDDILKMFKISRMFLKAFNLTMIRNAILECESFLDSSEVPFNLMLSLIELIDKSKSTIYTNHNRIGLELFPDVKTSYKKSPNDKYDFSLVKASELLSVVNKTRNIILIYGEISNDKLNLCSSKFQYIAKVFENITLLKSKIVTGALPITFSIPKSKFVDLNIKKLIKKYVTSPLIPGVMSTYIYSTEIEYYKQYQQSLFALTPKKAGWDCLRHYEVVANGCLPVIDLTDCPENTMYNFPKSLIKEIHQLYNRFKDLPISQEIIDICTPYIEQITSYFYENLTCDVVAMNMLKRINFNPENKKILYLSGDLKPDYQRCLTLIGLKQLCGSNCHDYPKVPHIYEDYTYDLTSLYGKGMTYSKVLNHSLHDRSLDNNIENLIANKYFDLVIYGSHTRGIPFIDLVRSKYSNDEIILINGEDLPPNFLPYDDIKIFIREMI